MHELLTLRVPPGDIEELGGIVDCLLTVVDTNRTTVDQAMEVFKQAEVRFVNCFCYVSTLFRIANSSVKMYPSCLLRTGGSYTEFFEIRIIVIVILFVICLVQRKLALHDD